MKNFFIPALLIVTLSFGMQLRTEASDNDVEVDGKEERSERKFRELAIGVTLGVVADMSQLGSAITNDGVVDLNPDSLASSTGITKLLIQDRDMALQHYSSEGTNTGPLQIIDDYETGGPLIGLDTGIYAMYDFNERFRLPFFVRVGFDYAFKVTGGEQMLRLGPGPDQFAFADNSFAYPDHGFEGGTLETSWSSEWMEVPVTIGIIIPVMDRGKIYGGLGVSWFSGGFSINVKADKKYTAYVTSFSENDYDFTKAELTDLMVSENINETIEFKTQGISFNMLLGFETFITNNVAATVEYWKSATMQTVYAESEFSDTAKRVMTMATAGPEAADKDPEYIERFAYPVVIGTEMLKFGVKYYFM